MSSVGLINHVLIIPVLLDNSGRDAWVAVLFMFIPFFIWTLLLFFIMKRSGQRHLIDWISERCGAIVANSVAIIASIYLLISSAVTARDTTTWAVASYLPNTPRIVLLILMLVLCYITVIHGLRVIAIMAGILLPGIVLLGFFVMGSNVPNKDYTRLFPIFEHGMTPIWKGMLICGSGLVEITILLFMQHYLTHKIKFWNLAVLSFILVCLTLGPVTGGLAEFGNEELSKLRYPAFEEWKLILILKNVERMDFFSIYQWLSGAYLRISTTMLIVHDLLNRAHKRSTALLMLPIFLLLLVLTLIPMSDEELYRLIAYFYLPSSLIILGLLTVFFSCVAWISKQRSRSHV
jgi:spore germination protein (amino acid permease)